MYSILTLLFQDHGLMVVPLESLLTLQGPFSPNAALTEGTPGPPWIHIDRGAFLGSFRASKNQKKVLTSYSRPSAGLGARWT